MRMVIWCLQRRVRITEKSFLARKVASSCPNTGNDAEKRVGQRTVKHQFSAWALGWHANRQEQNVVENGQLSVTLSYLGLRCNRSRCKSFYSILRMNTNEYVCMLHSDDDATIARGEHGELPGHHLQVTEATNLRTYVGRRNSPLCRTGQMTDTIHLPT